MATRTAWRKIGMAAVIVALAAALQAQGGSKIGPKDQLTITVVGGVDLGATNFVVDSEGSIDYPYLGKVKVQGLTTSELAARLSGALVQAKVLVGTPQLTIELKQIPNKTVSVSGAVAQKGEIQYAGELSVYNALLRVGGTTTDAGDDVQVVRAAKGDTEPDVLTLSRKKIELGDYSTNVMLEDGDRVIVLEAKQVFIGGYVNRPGPYTMKAGTTLRQALLIAGDITELGAANRIEIVRNGKKLERKDIDLDKTKIEPGDTITVPKKRM